MITGLPLRRTSHVRGLLLAAGAGRRMGAPKALVRVTADAPTLVERGIAELLDGGCDGVTVVIGAAASEVHAIVATVGRDVDVIECTDWAVGMGASLRAGLMSLTTTTREGSAPVEAALVTLVDLPDVGADVVHRVLTSFGTDAGAPSSQWRAQLGRAAYAGVPGHPALIGRDHWVSVAATAVGDRGARDYYRSHVHELIECGDLATGSDVDTPGELTSRG
ncbi:MAG: nucleotidyltransferase family protein [Terracoccus sp.]